MVIEKQVINIRNSISSVMGIYVFLTIYSLFILKDVLDFHNFLARSYLTLTYRGSIQEGVFSLGKPVLVMRDTTERPEGVLAGTLRLVGTDESMIYQSIRQLLEDKIEYKKMSKANNPYGDGNACMRIGDIISHLADE